MARTAQLGDAAERRHRFAGRLYITNTPIGYDKTLEDNTTLGRTISQLDGIGERSYYATDTTLAILVFEIADNNYSVSAEYDTDAVQPPPAELQDTLMQLAITFIATL